MASSTRQAIACILLIFAIVIVARSQGGPEKRPGATFSGKVTIKGKGAPGIAIGLMRFEEWSQVPTRHRALTDDQGNYRITNVDPGKYQLTVLAPGLVPALGSDGNKTFLISKGETVENVDFALVRGGVITGKVTDSDGRPIIEEDISLVSADQRQGSFYSRPPLPARTDDRGIYRMFGIPPGKYRVAVGREESFSSLAGGYIRTFHPAVTEASQATVIEVTEGSEATNVDITLPGPVVYYSAHGRVIDGDTGRPVANVSYGVQKYVNENSTTGISTGAVTNKDGEFNLENLSPGKYAVFVEVPPGSDWRADYVRFEVTDQNVTGLTVKTSRGAVVSGVIFLEGTDDKTIHAKLRSAPVYAQVSSPDSTRNSMQSSTINPDGSFLIGGLQAGIVTFGVGAHRFHVVRVERTGLVQTQGFELKDREQISGLRLIVNYATGAIQGVVKLDGGSIPANAQVMVAVKRLGEVPTPFSNFRESAQVDARGQFSVEGLLSGTYEITVGYAPEQRSPWRRSTQQVVVTNGAVSNVTVTVDTSANPRRP